MANAEQVARTQAELVEQFGAFLDGQPRERVAAFRAEVQALLAQTPEAELLRVVERVASTGDDWGYFPPEPFARRVHRALADVALAPGSGLLHGERLEAVRGRPLVFVPNHVSYSDANLFEILLARAGYADVAQRLTVVAGPKVYADALRRFLSLCFGTLKTAQSTSRASEEAVMDRRQVAQVARRTLELAFERLRLGDALLVFAEGARSRSGAMQRLLPAVARYLEFPGAVVVPVGIWGSEKLIPIGELHLHPACVRIALGEPLGCEALLREAGGKRAQAMQRLGEAIAALLPVQYRGVYGGA